MVGKRVVAARDEGVSVEANEREERGAGEPDCILARRRPKPPRRPVARAATTTASTAMSARVTEADVEPSETSNPGW